MSRTIWRLLEPGEFIHRDDQFFYKASSNLSGYWGFCHEEGTQVSDGFYRRRETIPDSPAPSWISVKDAMPDPKEWVLVLGEDRVPETGYVHSGTVSFYTHWAPIPKLPEPAKDPDEEAYMAWRSNQPLVNADLAWKAALAYAREGVKP